jgi:CubicO group peptidase (beta-lactamase class C family)
MMIEALDAAFRENFKHRGELGAAVAVWKDGVECVSLCGGRISRGGSAADWTNDTLVPVWSTGKGPAAATLLVALDNAGLDLQTSVRKVWPELGVGVTFGQLLTHQAGLAALDDPVSVWDYHAVIHALERQPPNWPPATAHGYHPRTAGFLWDECVRRLASGKTLGETWRNTIAGPLGIDVWIGLPASEFSRVAAVHPGKSSSRPGEEGFLRAFADPHSLTRRAFSSPFGLSAISEMNAPKVWSAGFPAIGAIASARGLAKFYGILANGGGGVISGKVLEWMETAVVDGSDRVLCLPTAFSAGFQKDPLGAAGRKLRHHYGPSARAFGHPGAGGSVAFADPDRRLGFAYVMNLVEPGVMPNARARALVEAAYSD